MTAESGLERCTGIEVSGTIDTFPVIEDLGTAGRRNKRVRFRVSHVGLELYSCH